MEEIIERKIMKENIYIEQEGVKRGESENFVDDVI